MVVAIGGSREYFIEARWKSQNNTVIGNIDFLISALTSQTGVTAQSPKPCRGTILVELLSKFPLASFVVSTWAVTGGGSAVAIRAAASPDEVLPCLCHHCCCLCGHLCLELSQFTLARMVLWVGQRISLLLWIELCPPQKKICWSPSSQYLRLWPYLEIGFDRSSQVKMRSLRYAT